VKHARDAETFGGVAKEGEAFEQVGNAFAEAYGSGKEDFEAVRWRGGGAGEAFEANAVGDDVDFFRGKAHLDEGASGEGGGDGDGVGLLVDLLLSEDIAEVGDGAHDVPAAVLLGDDFFLVALVGRAAVADHPGASGLKLAAGAEAGAGDGDEDVGRGGAAEAAAGPGVEGEGIGVVEGVAELVDVQAGAEEEHLWGVEPGEGLDFSVRDVFALEPGPGIGGVDLLEMSATVHLARQLKVMEDAEDGLNDAHRGLVASFDGSA